MFVDNEHVLNEFYWDFVLEDGIQVRREKPSLTDVIKKDYDIDSATEKPLNISELSQRIGEEPSLLLCAMLSSIPACSKFGVECLIEVLAGIAGDQSIFVKDINYATSENRPYGFKLCTAGFLDGEFQPIQAALGKYVSGQMKFIFTPELKVSKSNLRETELTNHAYSVDLKIDMVTAYFVNEPDQPSDTIVIPIASVVVEFDGPSHLKDEQVRKDKVRDSMVQSQGCTVFRVQTPYKQEGKGSSASYRKDQSDLLSGQVEDIKNHFRRRLFDVVDAHFLFQKVKENIKS